MTEKPGARPLFRAEAIAQHQLQREDGHLLRLSPAWTRAAYWPIVLAVLAALAFCLLGNVGEFASGPSVFRVDGRVDLTATSEEIVGKVEVQPGERVSEGQLLVRFYAADESAELARLDHELELQLGKLLADERDKGARAAVTSLRAQRELAAAKLAQRSLVAPRAGVISDVRIRPGQRLLPGEIALSLIGSDARFSVVALLPGNYRPLLHAGLPLRLDLDGFRYQYQDLTIDSVGDEVVGPAEARRYLGAEIADALSLRGPVVLVRASVPASSFFADGRSYNYFDGMHGTAEVRVRSRSIVTTLIPALEALWPAHDG